MPLTMAQLKAWPGIRWVDMLPHRLVVFCCVWWVYLMVWSRALIVAFVFGALTIGAVKPPSKRHCGMRWKFSRCGCSKISFDGSRCSHRLTWLSWSPDGMFLAVPNAVKDKFYVCAVIDRVKFEHLNEFVGHRKPVVVAVRCVIVACFVFTLL